MSHRMRRFDRLVPSGCDLCSPHPRKLASCKDSVVEVRSDLGTLQTQKDEERHGCGERGTRILG